MKAWKSVELQPEDARKFRIFLVDKSITHNTCGAWNLVHFEVLVTEDQAKACNTFLSTL